MKNIFLLIALLTSSIAYACRCEDPGTVSEAFSYTPVVVHGKVLKKSFVSFKSSMNEKGAAILEKSLGEHEQLLFLLNSEFVVQIELEVVELFKGGIRSDTITIFTTRNSASCGFTRFEEGRAYLIYAFSKSYAYHQFNSKISDIKLEQEHTYWTNHCTKTIEFNLEEANELKKLSHK